jgi:hypothetical protein
VVPHRVVDAEPDEPAEQEIEWEGAAADHGENGGERDGAGGLSVEVTGSMMEAPHVLFRLTSLASQRDHEIGRP